MDDDLIRQIRDSIKALGIDVGCESEVRKEVICTASDNVRDQFKKMEEIKKKIEKLVHEGTARHKLAWGEIELGIDRSGYDILEYDPASNCIIGVRKEEKRG